MEQHLFSVVIPLYNKANTVKRTVNSVLNQTCQDFEIVVVDDGSIDNSTSIVQEIGDDRITVIQQPNNGVSEARNKGIEHAKGQFITFLDADDEYDPNHLETLKQLIDTFPDYNVYATSFKRITNGKTTFPSIKNLYFKEYKKNCMGGVVLSYFHTVSSRHNPLHIGSIAIRSNSLGEIRFPVRVKSGEDQYFIARLMIDNELVFSPNQSYIYNFEESNRPKKLHEKVDDCFDSLLQLDCKDKYMRHYVALWHTRRAIYAMRTKSFKIIAYHLWRSLQIRPFQTKIITAMLSALIRR